MQMPETVDLRYPIGKPEFAELYDRERNEAISVLENAPGLLRAAVEGLTDAQLDTPYRPGGWTVRQVVHHLPDSHMNAYVRFRLALTEIEPVIKPYDEQLWAALPDNQLPPDASLRLFQALHERWVALCRALTPEQWTRSFRHPQLGRLIRLDQSLGVYAWHSRHHTAHITSLRTRLGWR
jgi:hypothetical protein